LKTEYEELTNNFTIETELFKYISSQEYLTQKFGINGSKVNHPFTCNSKSSLSKEGGLQLFLESSVMDEISIQFKVSNPNQINIYYLWLKDYNLDLDDAEKLGFSGYADKVLFKVGQGDVKLYEEYFQSENVSDMNNSGWNYVICTEVKTSKYFLM